MTTVRRRLAALEEKLSPPETVVIWRKDHETDDEAINRTAAERGRPFSDRDLLVLVRWRDQRL